jgi:hypothetical protein
MGKAWNACKILVEKPDGNRPLGRTTRRWVDKVKLDLRQTGRGVMDWIGLAQDRDQWRALVNTVMNLRVPQIAGKFLSSFTSDVLSRRDQLRAVKQTPSNIESNGDPIYSTKLNSMA